MSQRLGTVEILLKAVDEMSTTLRKTEDALSSLKTTTEETGQKTKGLSGYLTQAGVNIMSFGQAISSLGGPFDTLGSVITGFGKGGFVGAAVAGVGELVQGLKWSVGEAQESEQAFKNLAIAVELSGVAWGDVEGKTRGYLAELQRTTVYSDEALAGMVERLLTFGMTYDQAMSAAATALDLAAAKHMDLESAAGLMGKAFMGNTAILQRYGIDIQTSKEATAALKDAVATVADAIKTGGDNLVGFSTTLAEAGVSLTTAEGKMRGAKDIAEELIGAFQSGTIDAEAFDQIMGELGVTIDTSKLKAADFPAVMAALNEQFGGTAQEQAKTYAGIQERLKNATSELGEKIGGMVLPALAGMTEAMIPVVDWFGKGLDSIQAWLTEVGKMPEVQTVMAVVNEAFQGFWNYLNDVWKFIQDTFGPALEELWSAFRDLWDALSPIGEALQELFSIFGDIDSIDLLKIVLQAVVLQIRAVAAIIKEVAPYIKAFAQGFKEAADFITPVLKQIVDAVQWFCDMVKLGFQTLYTWLVGGSLWSDLWDSVITIASGAIGQLLNDLTSKLFGPMQNAFTTATDAVKETWDTSWQAVQTTFDTITSQIQTGLNTRFDEMKTFVTQNLGEYAPIANDALSAMQAAANAVMALIRGDWGGFLDGMNNALYLFWGAIQGMTSAAFAQLDSSFRGSMDALKGILDFAIGAMQSAWTTFTSFISQGIEGFKSAVSTASDWLTSTLTSMQSTASTILNQISDTFWSTVNSLVSAAQSLWDSLVGGSIWTDMLEEMQAQTQSALGNIVGDFQGAFGDVALSVPTMVQSQAGPSRGSEASAPLISQLPQSITIPVQVQVDGATVARTVTTRLVHEISARRNMR
jgi:phage-related protein